MNNILIPFAHIRKKVYWWLERPDRNARGPKILEILLIVLITANVIFVIMETADSIYERWSSFFIYFENISLCIFIVEYLARLWVVPENPEQPSRTKWARSPLAVIDFVVIFPALLVFIFPMDLRLLRALRMLRLLKLTRYSSAFSMLTNVLEEEAGAFLACLFFLFIMLIFASGGIWLAEHKVQPEAFGSIFHSMWWAVATLTTVGYGDVVPITILGKTFGALVTILGVGVAALPAGIIASGLNTQIHLRRKNLEQEFRKAFEDGDFCERDEADINALRRKLGLPKRLADSIKEQVYSEIQQSKEVNKHRSHCNSCGQKLR